MESGFQDKILPKLYEIFGISNKGGLYGDRKSVV